MHDQAVDAEDRPRPTRAPALRNIRRSSDSGVVGSKTTTRLPVGASALRAPRVRYGTRPSVDGNSTAPSATIAASCAAMAHRDQDGARLQSLLRDATLP